jgi:hypothetical protein
VLPNHFRIRRPLAALLAGSLIAGGVLITAPAAQADTRSGEVTVSIPSRIVIDGSNYPVSVISGSMYSSDKVWMNVYRGDSLEDLEKVAPNTVVNLSSRGLNPGQLVGKADLPMTGCKYSSSQLCFWNSDYTWYYEFIRGLTFSDSATATAKYASTVSLAAANDGSATTWTATARQYGGYDWKAWSGASVTIGSTTVTADSNGIATWVESTSDLHTFTATAAESDTVWSASSAAVTPARPVAAPTPADTSTPVSSKPSAPAKPGRITTSATASKAATALKKGLPSVRKVVTITKKNDANKLLGRSNGYVSAAVLYDRGTSCSGKPGVDCGATVEKFTSTAKAKARKSYIQRQLRKFSFLGDEHDVVHGKFLFRISDDLSYSKISAYKKAFSKAF